ncbi:Gti1/Pac2 family-domain-containing protein [Mycena amicta]|nr:Gti1/Pac2 family-domain-containing protein [Mycena amicta]
MSFRPGLSEPKPGPYLTHPSLRIRDVADAHKVLEAVRLNISPLIRRRLFAHERAQLRSGNVFVWEECDVDEGGLVRWTEGRRWSQSRMRGDFLFYEEKVETTSEEKQAKAARRASKAADSSLDFPPPPKRKDRPAKQDGLTKQTYSVTVRPTGPGADAAPRKWHLVAYFSTFDYALLPVVDDYGYLRDLRISNGIFMRSRVLCAVAREHVPSSSKTDPKSNCARESQSPASPAVELVAPASCPGFSSSNNYNYTSYALPPPELYPRSGSIPRVSLPPFSSLGYPTSKALLGQPYSSPHGAQALSREDRRLLNSLRVVI